MNSPLELHKVRLRGLGGQAVCGVSMHLRVRNGVPIGETLTIRGHCDGEDVFVRRI